MTTKIATTTALILATFALVGGAIIPAGVVPTPVAYAQLSDVGDIVDDSLETVGITEEEVEDSNTEQPIDQGVGQRILDQSEENDQDDDNAQIQTGVDDQDTAQGTVDGNDLAESSSESGKANKKYSSSSSSFSDTDNNNEQGAGNDAELNQDEEQDVDQDHAAIFADDTADLDPANVGVPIAIPINVQEELEEVVDGDNRVVCILNQGELQLVELTAEVQDFIDAGFVTELPLEACLNDGISLG